MAAGGATWTRWGTVFSPLRISAGALKLETLSGFCPPRGDTWMTFWPLLTAPHTPPEMASEQEWRAAFLPWKEPSLPQLLGPPAPWLHHGDLVKGDQCQKKGAVDLHSPLHGHRASGNKTSIH